MSREISCAFCPCVEILVSGNGKTFKQWLLSDGLRLRDNLKDVFGMSTHDRASKLATRFAPSRWTFEIPAASCSLNQHKSTCKGCLNKPQAVSTHVLFLRAVSPLPRCWRFRLRDKSNCKGWHSSCCEGVNWAPLPRHTTYHMHHIRHTFEIWHITCLTSFVIFRISHTMFHSYFHDRPCCTYVAHVAAEQMRSFSTTLWL